MIKFDKNKDYIAIIAPASLPKDVDKSFMAAMKLLEQHGFMIKYHPEMFSRKSLDFFAAKKHIRTEGLRHALEDPNVKIIWGFRGGYGSTEIISDCCDLKPINDKLLVGFSDITALHALFNDKFKMPSLHGVVLTSAIDKQQSSFREIISLFEEGQTSYDLQLLNEAAANIISPIEADIKGGNLVVFCNLIGTKLHPDTAGKILILEDIGECGYQIHRYFMHLHNANLLDKPAAIILGDFTKGDNLVEAALDDICYRYLKSVPVYRLEGFGHGDVNHPVLLGGKAKIEGGKLSFASPLRFSS